MGTTNKRLQTQSVRSSQFDQVPGYLSYITQVPGKMFSKLRSLRYDNLHRFVVLKLALSNKIRAGGYILVVKINSVR